MSVDKLEPNPKESIENEILSHFHLRPSSPYLYHTIQAPHAMTSVL